MQRKILDLVIGLLLLKSSFAAPTDESGSAVPSVTPIASVPDAALPATAPAAVAPMNAPPPAGAPPVSPASLPPMPPPLMAPPTPQAPMQTPQNPEAAAAPPPLMPQAIPKPPMEQPPMAMSDVQASKVMEGIDEDKITAEIEDLQAKLGALQANIDDVLKANSSRKKREVETRSGGGKKNPDVSEMGDQLDEVLATVETLKAFMSKHIKGDKEGSSNSSGGGAKDKEGKSTSDSESSTSAASGEKATKTTSKPDEENAKKAKAKDSKDEEGSGEEETPSKDRVMLADEDYND